MKCNVQQFYQRQLNKIQNYYFANATTERERAVQYVNLISDMNMVYALDKTAKEHSKHATTYYYEWVLNLIKSNPDKPNSERHTIFRFTVSADLNVFKLRQAIDLPGAVHSDDLCYVFR